MMSSRTVAGPPATIARGITAPHQPSAQPPPMPQVCSASFSSIPHPLLWPVVNAIPNRQSLPLTLMDLHETPLYLYCTYDIAAHGLCRSYGNDPQTVGL